MLLTVVGSGDAFNSLGRAHSAYVLEGEGIGRVMVDFGATSLQALRRVGRAPNELDALVLTHLHGDHVGGLPFLLIDAMYNEPRRRPLDVVGPALTRARLEEVMRAAYGALTDRERGFELVVREVLPGDVVEVAGLELRAFAAEHMDPPERPLCVRLTAPGGRSVAFSGDTELCSGLFEAAEDADLLVAECTALAPPAGRHSTWTEWKASFGRLGARRLLLSHLGKDVRERIPSLLAEAPPGLQLAFADDGQIVVL